MFPSSSSSRFDEKQGPKPSDFSSSTVSMDDFPPFLDSSFTDPRLASSLLLDDRTLGRMRSLTAEIRQLKGDANRKETTLMHAQKKIEDLTRSLQERNSTISSLHDSVSQCRSREEKLRNELQQTKAKLVQSEQREMQLTHEFKSYEQDMMTKDREFQFTLADLETRLSAMRGEVEKKEILRQKAEYELSIAISDAKRMKDLVHLKESERVEVEEKVEYRLHELKKDRGNLAQRIEELEGDNQFLNRKVAELERRIAESSEEVKRVHDEKSKQFELVSEQQRELSEIRNERFQLKQLVDFLTPLRARVEKYEEMERDYEEVKEEKERIHWNYIKSEERLKASNMENESARQKNTALESEVAALKGAIERMKLDEQIIKEERLIDRMEVERHSKTLAMARLENERMAEVHGKELRQVIQLLSQLNYAIKLATVVPARSKFSGELDPQELPADSDEPVSLESILSAVSLQPLSTNVRNAFQSLHEALLLLSVECESLRQKGRDLAELKSEHAKTEDSFTQWRLKGKQIEMELEQIKIDVKKRDEELIQRIRTFTLFLDSLSALSSQYQLRAPEAFRESGSDPFSIESLRQSFSLSMSPSRFQLHQTNNPVDWIFITESLDRILSEVQEAFRLQRQEVEQEREEKTRLEAVLKSKTEEFDQEIGLLRDESERLKTSIASVQSSLSVSEHSHEMAERAARLLYRALIPALNRISELKSQKQWLARQYMQAETIKQEIRALRHAITGDSSKPAGIRRRHVSFRSAAIAVLAFNRLIRFVDQNREFGRSVQVFNEQFYLIGEETVNETADLSVEDSSFTRSAASLYKLIKELNSDKSDRSFQLRPNLISQLSAGFYRFYAHRPSDRPVSHVSFVEERDDLSAIRRIALKLANAAHLKESDTKAQLELTKALKHAEQRVRELEKTLESVSAELSQSRSTVAKLREESASQSSAIHRQLQTISEQAKKLADCEDDQVELRNTQDHNKGLLARVRELEEELQLTQHLAESVKEENHSLQMALEQKEREAADAARNISTNTGIIRPLLVSPQPGIAKSKTKKIKKSVAASSALTARHASPNTLMKATPLSSDRSVNVNDGVIRIIHQKGGKLSVELEGARLKDASLSGANQDERKSVQKLLKSAQSSSSHSLLPSSFLTPGSSISEPVSVAPRYRPSTSSSVQRSFDKVDSIDLRLNVGNRH